MGILSHYEHIASLGEGHFSIVTRYRHKETQRLVAVKKLKSLEATHIARIEREVEILRQLNGHPNIIELIDHEFSADNYLYLMPSASRNLDNFISYKNQSLSELERVSLFDQILDAIQYAHSQGIIHRDINPNNVLIFEEESDHRAKVCDFGLGKQLNSDSGFTRSSVVGYGQTRYLAPEQEEQLNNADARSDIYSLGRLLNFVLTGRRPDNIYRTTFDRLIQKATQDDPALRHQTIDEFISQYVQMKALFYPQPQEEEAGDNWIKTDGEIDWEKFHQFAATRFDGDADTYIGKILSVFEKRSNLHAYANAKADQLLNFVDTFTDSIKRLPSNGYDFRILDPSGEILHAIFTTVSDPQIKLECFEGMMVLASDLDQWDVQNLIVRILRAPTEYRGIENQIASILLSYKWKPRENLDDAPAVIKRACAVSQLT